jgi:hypothetical protein
VNAAGTMSAAATRVAAKCFRMNVRLKKMGRRVPASTRDANLMPVKIFHQQTPVNQLIRMQSSYDLFLPLSRKWDFSARFRETKRV